MFLFLFFLIYYTYDIEGCSFNALSSVVIVSIDERSAEHLRGTLNIGPIGALFNFYYDFY